MYHPTRGGVRGGRDQFKWDDVKADKHRENYLGHSVMAPVGRWQKGKDLHWYARDKRAQELDMKAAQEEIKKIKEQEEAAMREALGLAPKRASRPQGNRLDKHEFTELVKRGSTAEDLGEGHAEAAKVHGLGFSREGRNSLGQASTCLQSDVLPEKGMVTMPSLPTSSKNKREDSDDEANHKKRRREEKKQRHSEDKKKHKKDEKRRHDSD